MATLCEHCQEPIKRNESYVFNGGYSYHRHCRRCYICNEDNLKGAEIFKGVIFCAECSKRIFKGCTDVRHLRDEPKTRRRRRFRSESRSRTRERWERSRSRQKRELERLRHIRTDEYVKKTPRRTYSTESDSPGILERTCLLASTINSTDGSSKKGQKSDLLKSHSAYSKDYKPHNIKCQLQNDLISYPYDKCIDENFTKRGSTDAAVITDITSDFLNDIFQYQINMITEFSKVQTNYPVPESNSKRRSKRKSDISKSGKITSSEILKDYSDLRIAELGQSTEIAHLALRRKSEMPVIITSKSRLQVVESDTSGEQAEEDEWTDDESEERSKIPLMDRHIGSVLQFPFQFFKNKILRRSSLISFVISTGYEQEHIAQRFKNTFFNDNAVRHRRHGVKILYKTINRWKTPYKFGWLCIGPKRQRCCITSGDCEKHPVQCKHYRTSHSYRCMRERVMRSAGPTKSDLELFRLRVVNFFKGRLPLVHVDEALSYSEPTPTSEEQQDENLSDLGLS